MGFSIGSALAGPIGLQGSALLDSIKRNSTSTETNNYTPSPWDIEKAKTLNMLRSLLFPSLTSDLAGATTSKSQGASDLETAKGVFQNAGAGVGKGDVNLLDSMSKSLGKNNNAMSMAMQLYGFQPQMSGSYTQESDPSMMQKIASLVGIGKSVYNAGSSFKKPGSGNTGSSGG